MMSTKVHDVINNRIIPVANKISTQRYITAIKNGLMFTVPLTIIGGFSQIIAQPPIDPKVVLPTNIFNEMLLAWKMWSVKYAALLTIPYNMTMGLLALFAAIAIAYNLAKQYKIDPLSSSITALLTFLVVCSPTVSILKDKPASLFLSTDYLGSKGLFTAIIIGLLTVEITRFLLEKNIKIRMPDSVPPMVTASFEAIIPLLLNVIIFMCINQVFELLFHMNISLAIMKLFSPFVSASDTLPAILISVFLINILWFFGIHGGAIANAILMPFFLTNLAENAAAVAAGQVPIHIFAGYYYIIFMNIGGSGCALGLAVAILICAKSAQLKSLSRVGIIPVAFNISEPFVFGTPMIMNLFLFIPMIFVPTINGIIAHFMFSMKIVRNLYILIPFSTPGFISAFLSTMDFKSVILWFSLLTLDVVLYLPFVKAYDNSLVKQERTGSTEGVSNGSKA